MRGNEFLDKMELIDPAYVEAADAPIKAKRSAWVKKFVLAAACIVLMCSVGLGTYAYAAEVKEYNDAVQFFDDYDMSTDGLTREEIKTVYKDITTNSFSNGKTAEVIFNNSAPELVRDYINSAEKVTPEDVENFWNTRNSVTFPTTEPKPEETDPVEKDCGGRHRYGNGTVIINEGSCTEERTIGVRCIYCGYAHSTTTLGKVHSFGDYVVTVAQTCTTSGKKVAECTLCGAKDEKYIPAGHKYEDYTVLKDATCSARGEISFDCTVCGNRQIETVPPLEHDWYVVDTPATCTKGGQKIKYCQTCGVEVELEYYFPKGHNFVQDDYSKVWICTQCGRSHGSIHKYSERKYTYVKMPTCMEEGILSIECMTCGFTFESAIAKSKHEYIYETVKEPTCAVYGTEKGVCKYGCGSTHERSISKISHNFKYVTDSNLRYECTACGCVAGKDLTDVIPIFNCIAIDGEREAAYEWGIKINSHEDAYLVDENYRSICAEGNFEVWVALGEKGMYIYADIKDKSPTFDAKVGANGDYLKLYLDWCTPDLVHPRKDEIEYMMELGKWDPIKYRDMYGVSGLQYIGWLNLYSNGYMDAGMGFKPHVALGPDATEPVLYKSVQTDDGWACEIFIPWRDAEQKEMIAENEWFHIGLGIEVGDDATVGDGSYEADVKRYDQSPDIGSRYFENYALLQDLEFGEESDRYWGGYTG